MPVLRASCAARVCQNFAIEEGDGSDGAKRAMHAKSAAAVLLERLYGGRSVPECAHVLLDEGVVCIVK